MMSSPVGPDKFLAERLADRIRVDGPLAFDDWVEACLYDPDGGFYATGGAAGRRGDFLTSPEVGPLFGALLARWLDDRWTALGRPVGFTVVEAAAGVGTLARAVLASDPACLVEGRYVMVERSSPLRAAQPTGDRLASVVSLEEVGPVDAGVVVANELLDNLAFGLAASNGADWREVRVGLSPQNGPIETFVEVLGQPIEPSWPLSPAAAGAGVWVPVQAEAARWVESARELIRRGSVLVFDYTSTTAELAARPVGEWVRTYRGHDRGGPPVDAPGSQDVTVEVAVDQLPPGAVSSTQADFLRHHDIGDLVEAGSRLWEKRAHLGDLDALRARSRISEAEALLDPSGLGGFTVLEWHVSCSGGS